MLGNEASALGSNRTAHEHLSGLCVQFLPIETAVKGTMLHPRPSHPGLESGAGQRVFSCTEELRRLWVYIKTWVFLKIFPLAPVKVKAKEEALLVCSHSLSLNRRALIYVSASLFSQKVACLKLQLARDWHFFPLPFLWYAPERPPCRKAEAAKQMLNSSRI